MKTSNWSCQRLIEVIRNLVGLNLLFSSRSRTQKGCLSYQIINCFRSIHGHHFSSHFHNFLPEMIISHLLCAYVLLLNTKILKLFNNVFQALVVFTE